MCRGAACEDWSKCRGETIPPWDCGPHKTTSQASFREQDILAAADALAEAANAYHEQTDDKRWDLLHNAIHAYNAARRGMTPEAYLKVIRGEAPV